MKRVVLVLAAVVLSMALLLALIVEIGLRRIASLERAGDEPITPAAQALIVAGAPAHAAEGSLNLIPKTTARAADLHAHSVTAAGSPAPANGRALNRAKPSGGQIELMANTAKLNGQTLRLQGTSVRNVGLWYHAQDSIQWTLNAPRAGLYRVLINYACDANEGGGVYEMHVGKHRFTGTSASTGSWDQYHTLDVGNLTLAAGPTAITLKPIHLDAGKALMNVRSVRIVPVEAPEE